MNDQKDKAFLQNRSSTFLKGIWQNFVHELKTTFKDRGVVIMFILGPLAYPILYCSIYKNETLIDVPIAVVDNSRTPLSRELIRHIDASENVKISNFYSSLYEAKEAFNKRIVHGVIFIPSNFNKKINANEQATVSLYCDISSFMYYRVIYQSCNYSILDMSKNIQIKRLNATGITGESASMIAEPLLYKNISLYNEGIGFASFLMPAILILILFQTLFFGITMLAGTSREENRFHVLVTENASREGIYSVIIGKSAFYFIVYAAWIFYVLGVIPHVFNLPHIGNPSDIFKLMIPFLLATIFFCMTISVFIPNRETSIVLFMFFSIILLFLSGISWPQSNINGFWKIFSWIFPSTHGIQGYIKINTMGTDIQHASFEYISLWLQTALYFITATATYHWQIKRTNNQYKQMKYNTQLYVFKGERGN